MRLSATDPITGHDGVNTATHLVIPVEHPDCDLPTLDNPARMGEER